MTRSLNPYIKERISDQDDERLFFIGEAIRRGTTLEEIHNMTKIDYFFLNKFQHICINHFINRKNIILFSQLIYFCF